MPADVLRMCAATASDTDDVSGAALAPCAVPGLLPPCDVPGLAPSASFGLDDRGDAAAAAAAVEGGANILSTLVAA